jgi:hexosaminidase
MNFLKAVNSWVFLPIEVSVEISKNGTDYKKVGSIKGDIDDRNYLVKSVPFNFDFEAVEAQYLRITAISLKQCPEWHRGFGKPSWIFLDEVLVE